MLSIDTLYAFLMENKYIIKFCQFTKNIQFTCMIFHRIHYSDRFIQKFMSDVSYNSLWLLF